MRRRRIAILALAAVVIGGLCAVLFVMRPAHPTDISSSQVGWIELRGAYTSASITDREQIERIIENFNKAELGEGEPQGPLMIGGGAIIVDIYRKNGERYRVMTLSPDGKMIYGNGGLDYADRMKYATQNPSIDMEYLSELLEREGDNLLH